MVLVLTKKTKKVTAPVADFETSTPSDIVAMMEELAAMQPMAEALAAQIKTLQTKLKPYTEKTKQLAELVTKYGEAAERADDAEWIEESENATLQIGKRGNERRVASLELAMKRLGKKVFFEKATIGLGVLDQYLTPAEKAEVITVDRTMRSVKIVRRAKEQEDAA